MIRKRKHKEENIYIRAILFIVPTLTINKIKKEGLKNKKEAIINFLPFTMDCNYYICFLYVKG
ncbi:hypothetical protein [Brachyspira alvinipulli]|uniref:hypothetical protein n=1 Tax=Brachyspira alvinipulli TaxID=84379 RepID=UPI000480AB27|nr:hypothetical protein [Brachyspira alvinipulli]